ERSTVHKHRDHRLVLSARRDMRSTNHCESEIFLRPRQLDRSATRRFGAHVLALAEHQHDCISLGGGSPCESKSAAVGCVYRRAADADHARRGTKGSTNSCQDTDCLFGPSVGRPPAERGTSVICEWADDGNGAEIFPERKRLVCVFEQNDSFACCIPRRSEVRWCERIEPLARGVAEAEGIAEQTERVLDTQHSAHGGIDQGDGYSSRANQRRETG